MPITIDVRSGAEVAVLDAAFADLRMVDELFSTFREDSLVSRINAGRLRVGDAGPLVDEVLALCDRYEAMTRGYFSPWRAGVFDPSGLVKGWAIARVAEKLDRHGCRDYFVDAAGDVRTRGHSTPGSPWRVGIRHPVQRDKVARVVLATDLAVLGVVEEQVGELASLLHEVDARETPHLLLEPRGAEQLGQHDPGILEAQGLVEIAGQQIEPAGRALRHESRTPYNPNIRLAVG